MWRRVASQSPIAPPANETDAELGRRYFDAWDALGKLIGSGRSLSGRERNCCFLNTGSPRFADISAVSRFDFPDDTTELGDGSLISSNDGIASVQDGTLRLTGQPGGETASSRATGFVHAAQL